MEQAVQKDPLKSLRRTALIFFIVIGLTHIITGLMVSKGYYTSAANIVNRILDIPFAIIAIIYGLSNFRVKSDGNQKKIVFTAMIALSLLVLALLLYLNLLVPDRVS